MTKSKCNVEFMLNELDPTKTITWNCYVDESDYEHDYDMIMGRDLQVELGLILDFDTVTVRGGELGAFPNCSTPMKEYSDVIARDNPCS